MLGQPLIPVLLLVLGANLAAGPGRGNIPTHSALAVVATRLVLLPLLGCAAVLTAQKTGLISMQDPLTLVVMMVAWSTPTGACCSAVQVKHKNSMFQSFERPLRAKIEGQHRRGVVMHKCGLPDVGWEYGISTSM